MVTLVWIKTLSMVATMIPVSTAGLGVRELMHLAMLGPLGVPKEGALALSMLVFISMLLLAAIGGIMELTRRGRKSTASTPEAAGITTERT